MDEIRNIKGLQGTADDYYLALRDLDAGHEQSYAEAFAVSAMQGCKEAVAEFLTDSVYKLNDVFFYALPPGQERDERVQAVYAVQDEIFRKWTRRAELHGVNHRSHYDEGPV